MRPREPLGLRFLVAIGCAAIAYALLLALGVVPVSPVPAAAAFALIGVTLFSLAWGEPEWGPAPAPSSQRTPAPLPAGSRHLRPIPIPHRPTSSGIASPIVPFSVPSMAPASLARAVSPGDALWARLAPDTAGVLPVELVGPMAESAFANLPGESYEPEGVGGPTWEGASLTASYAPAWPESVGERSWTPTEHEAFNGTPPHLRPSPPPLKEIRGPHPGADAQKPTAGADCASCHRGLTNPPAWRACSLCHRPFCGECAFRARRNLGNGRCINCRSYVEIEEPRFVA